MFTQTDRDLIFKRAERLVYLLKTNAPDKLIRLEFAGISHIISAAMRAAKAAKQAVQR